MGGPIKFRQNLRLFEAITIIVGSMIGSGILLLPADMAELLPSPGLILLVLVAGAVLTVVGALTFAELAALFPRAGGQYHFLREGLGARSAYLFGWTQFWVIQSGIIAGVGVAVARFVDYFAKLPGRPFNLLWDHDGDPFTLQKGLDGLDFTVLGLHAHLDPIQIPSYGFALVAIGTILTLATLNILSSRFGGVLQNVATVAKVTGLVALVVIIFAFGFGDRAPHAYEAVGGGLAPAGFSGAALVAAFGGALALSLFAFDGWPQATYVAAEVKNPRRNLPLALTIGPLVTSVIYIALAAAYFYVIPAEQAVQLGVNDQRIAPEAAGIVLGEQGRAFISGVALVSVVGTVNGFILTAPRIFYAFSRDGALLPSMGRLTRQGTPGWAIYFTAVWASLLVMTGGYQQLVTMVVFGIFLFYIPTSLAHIRMRGVPWLGLKGTHPAERAYKTPLYPFVPLLFLLSSVFVVVSIFIGSLAQALIASGLILLGVPAYYFQRRRTGAPMDTEAVEPAADAS